MFSADGGGTSFNFAIFRASTSNVSVGQAYQKVEGCRATAIIWAVSSVPIPRCDMLSSGLDHIHCSLCIYIIRIRNSVYLGARQSTRLSNAAAIQVRDLSNVQH